MVRSTDDNVNFVLLHSTQEATQPKTNINKEYWFCLQRSLYYHIAKTLFYNENGAVRANREENQRLLSELCNSDGKTDLL